MESLLINSTKETPYIECNHISLKCTIMGRSILENALKFYQPLTLWIEKIDQIHNNKIIQFDFNLEYFNTSTIKQLNNIFILLQQVAKTNTVVLNWHYIEEDNEAYETGIRFKKLFSFDFNLVGQK